MRRKVHKIISKRRRREGKTNYKSRLTVLKGGMLRLVIRRSLNNIYAQIIEYQPIGDKVLVSASGNDLEKAGWKYSKKNIPSAYLIGLILAKKAFEKKIKTATVDIGMHTNNHGSRLYALVKGAIDRGLEINCGEDALPSTDRLCGKHIANYGKVAKNNQFAKNKKDGADPVKIEQDFNAMKAKLMK